MSNEKMLSGHRLVLWYDGLKALDDVSIDICRGEMVGVVGPNGAGKSTLLRALSGQSCPNQGSIEIRGRRVKYELPWQFARAGVGCSFQSVRLFDRLTVAENLAMARHITGEESPVRALYRHGARQCTELTGPLARRVLERLGISRLAEQVAGTLSFGQRKMVSLLLLLLTECETILLDEPVGGLSPEAIVLVTAVIREEVAAGRTVVIVEHDLSLVWDLCDRIVVMAKGRISLEGKPDELERSKVLTVFAT